MKSSNADIDMLHQYLKGRLSAEASIALEKRLKEDSDLKEDYTALKVLSEGIRVKALTEKFDMLRAWESEKTPEPNTKENGWKWLKWIGLGLLLFLAGYLMYHFTLKEENEIPLEYKEIYAQRFDDELILHKTKRAAVQTDNLTQEQRRAYEMYSIQLFEEAIPLLDELWKSKSDTLALFYLGVSYIGTGEKDKGLKIFAQPALSNFSKQTHIFINH